MNTQRRRILAFLVTFSVVLTIITPSVIMATGESDNVSIQVDQDDLLDVILTRGTTDSTVSTFETDLTTALVNLGVPSDKINIQAVEASNVAAGNTSSGWEIYDHTNYSATALAYYRPYYQEVNGNYSLNSHVSVSTGTQTDIDFYGYGAPAYKDFMYMPNTDSGKKTFDFTIQEGVFYDALNGAGFLFNTTMSDSSNLASRTMSGYLMFVQYPYGSAPTVYIYKFTNIDVNAFHSSSGTAIQNYSGFTPIASFAVGTETTRVIKLETTQNSIKMWYNGTLANWTLSGTSTTTQTVTLPTDFGSYGFGPLVGYTSHGCAKPTHFTFLNVTMTTETARKFIEVIREPEWRENSKRFIINAQDDAVSYFSDATDLGEILTRLGNDEISYIGWGKSATDGNTFIAKNEGNGIYIDKTVASTDTYAEQIQAMAQYIYSKYIDGVQNNTNLLTYGNPNSLTISPASAQTDTIEANWPSGKWRIVHDENYYDNSTGTALYDGQYLNNLDVSFVETGKYDIYYQDVLIKTVYVHRPPIAGFDVSVNASNQVTISDASYDLDHQLSANKGIVSATWAYRETTSSTWISGMPTTLESNKNYVIRQIVEDEEGAEGAPFYRYVSTVSSASAKPIAEFTMSPGRLLTYQSETVSYVNSSYDPQNAAITESKWVISLAGTTIYTGSTPKTDFTGAAAGTYKISLTVKNANNVWSEAAARYLVVVRDSSAPSISSDTTAATYNTAKVVKVTVTDETGGSGFSARYSVVDHSSSVPSSWGSIGTNSVFSTTLATTGTWYIHVKALDYAGNQTITTFGPYVVSDNHAPTAPTLSVAPSYADGTWTTSSIVVSASGSTDDFTNSNDIVYSYSLNGAAYTAGTSVLISAQGTNTVSFKATDGSGNTSTVVTKVVKVDTTNPTSPTFSATSNSATYTPETWAVKAVTFTLSGATDAISAVANYEYRIDGGTWTTGSTSTISVSGQYELEYRAIDSAGNYSSVGTRSIWIDTVSPSAPAVSTTSAYTDGTWSGSSLTLRASGSTDNITTEANLVYSYAVDSSSYTTGNEVTCSTNGLHTIYFKVTDQAGNVSLITSRTIRIDSTNPTLPVYSAVTDSHAYTSGSWATNSVTFTLSSSTDDVSSVASYRYKIDSGEWQSGNTATITAAGKHTIQYASVDLAGNVSSTGTRDIWIDLTAPSSPTVSYSPSYTEGTWITSGITVSASGSTDNLTDSGLLAYAYSVDGSDYVSGHEVTISDQGSHTVSFRVRDAAGLTATIVTKTVKVDYTAPTRPVYSATADGSSYTEATWSRDPVTVTLSGSTDSGGSTLSNYAYKVNDGAWQTGNQVTISDTGKYTITCSAVDVAGNRSTLVTKEIWVDTSVPTTPSVEATADFSDDEWIGSPVTLTASGSSDDYSSGASLIYSYSINGDDFVAGNQVTLSDNGVYTIRFMTTDEAGNHSAYLIRTVNLDQTAPSIPVYTAFSNEAVYGELTWANDPVTFTLSDSEDEGGSDLFGYEYKMNDGEWQSGSQATITESGKYTIEYRSVDGSGNRSESVSCEIWIDTVTPDVPTISVEMVGSEVQNTITNISGSGISMIGTPNGEAPNLFTSFSLDHLFFNTAIKVTICTDDETSGIAKLYWKTGVNEVLQSSSEKSVTFTLPMGYSGIITAYSKDISGLTSAVKECEKIVLDNAKPVTSVTYNSGSKEGEIGINFVVSDAAAGLKTIRYRVGSGAWQTVNAVSGQLTPMQSYSISLTLPDSGITDDQFLVEVDVIDLAGNRLTSTVDMLPIVLQNMLDTFLKGTEGSSSETSISSDNVKDIMTLYNLLPVGSRTGILPATRVRLNQALNKLSQYLVIISKDPISGASANYIGTSTMIPEMSSSDVSLIQLELKAILYTAKTTPTYVSSASSGLTDQKISVLASYDVYLLKTVTTAGVQTSSHVANSEITDRITIDLPLSKQYSNLVGLQVIHIAEDGTVAYFDTEIVTIEGQKYLEFQTNHFSTYAIVASSVQGITKTGETDTNFALIVLLLTAAAVSLELVHRRRFSK